MLRTVCIESAVLANSHLLYCTHHNKPYFGFSSSVYMSVLTSDLETEHGKTKIVMMFPMARTIGQPIFSSKG